MVADIGLPTSTFQRAGTSVKSHVLVLEKHSNAKDAPNGVSRMDVAGETVKELFENLRHLSVSPRSAVTQAEVKPAAPKAEAVKGLSAEAMVYLDMVRSQPDAFQNLLAIKQSTGRYVLSNDTQERIWQLTNPELFANTTVDQRSKLMTMYNWGSSGITFRPDLMPLITKGLAGLRGKVVTISASGDAAINRYRELSAPLYDALTAKPSAVTETAETTTDDGAPPAPASNADTVPTTLRTTFHAKKKVNWYVVTLDRKESPESYEQVKAVAKQHNGYWSSYKGLGAIPGFQFTKEADAKAFQAALSGPTTESVAPVAPALPPTDRATLINRIVGAARKPMPDIRPVTRSLGTDGNWYSMGGMPIGVSTTGETKSIGFAFANKDTGGVFGAVEKTRQALIDRFMARQDSNDAELRQELEKSSDERLQEQAAFWLKGAPAKPEKDAELTQQIAKLEQDTAAITDATMQNVGALYHLPIIFII